ncbi:MAG: sugar phosphate isomerase/epimerase [Thermomicrobiales bacterium]
MRLGIDSFSVRSQDWDAFQILDYAAGLGLDNVHFSERAHLGGLDTSELMRVREYADELELTLEVGMRSFNKLATTFDPSLGTGEQQLLDMIDAAITVNSPIVRCFVGMQNDRAGAYSVADLIEETVRTLAVVAPRAEETGISIAVENHGGVDLLAPELRDIIERVGSSHVGVCLDTGNPVYAAEDAVYATEILAKYTVSTHLRDTKAWSTPTGAMVQWAPAGRGTVDLKRIVSILESTVPSVPIDLEVISGGRPKDIPFLDSSSDFWKIYPDMKADSLVRFIEFANKGSDGPIEQFVQGIGTATVSDEQMRTQQREHFEESVTYCRNVLGLGGR